MKRLLICIIVLFLNSERVNAAFSAIAIGQEGISSTFKKFVFTGAKTKQEALDSAILKCRTALELQWGCRIIRYEHWNDNTGKQKILRENHYSIKKYNKKIKNIRTSALLLKYNIQVAEKKSSKKLINKENESVLKTEKIYCLDLKGGYNWSDYTTTIHIAHAYSRNSVKECKDKNKAISYDKRNFIEISKEFYTSSHFQKNIFPKQISGKKLKRVASQYGINPYSGQHKDFYAAKTNATEKQKTEKPNFNWGIGFFKKKEKPKKQLASKSKTKLVPKKNKRIISPFEQKVLAAEAKEINFKCEFKEKLTFKDLQNKNFKLNFCIRKSDIIKLGEYKIPIDIPKGMSAVRGCKTEMCFRKKAGKNVYKIFVQRKEQYHARHPGDIIHGMAWFEILYLDKLKKTNTQLKRYANNDYNELTKLLKNEDEKIIYSLINLNKGRIKMREAMGMSLYDDVEIVLKKHWLLGDFLNNDKLKVKRLKIDPELKKRKKLLVKYKSILSKYKKKLNEKKNNS